MRDEFFTESQISKKRSQYKRKTKLEKWGGNTTWYEQVASMTRLQAIKFLRNIKLQTDRRMKSLARQGVDSYAAYKLSEELKNTRVNKNSNKQKISALLSAYHDFWSSRTSTAAGAKAVNREQDIRIFGATQTIKGDYAPTYRMNRDEREKFWAAYMEFFHQYRNATTKYDSSRVQRIMGEAMRDFGPGELQSRLDLIHKAVELDYEIESGKTAKERELSTIEDAADVYKLVYRDARNVRFLREID